MSWLTDNMIMYVGNSRSCIDTLLKSIGTLSNVEYKVNIQKPVSFLMLKKKLRNWKFKEVSFTIKKCQIPRNKSNKNCVRLLQKNTTSYKYKMQWEILEKT